MKPNTNPVETLLVTRTGQIPVRFTGQLLGSCNKRPHDSTRWCLTYIYRTQAGRILMVREHMTCWRGEQDAYSVESFPTATAAVQAALDSAGGCFTDADDIAIQHAAEVDDEFAAAYVLEIA